MRFLLVCILVVLLSACLDEPDCIVTSTNFVSISLRKASADSVDTVLFTKITVTGTDSVFYEGDSTSSLLLPLNPWVTETTFKFYYRFKIDSLTLAYTRQTKVISPACGAFNYYQDLSVVSTSFTLVTVINSQLSTVGSTNLEIKL